METKELIKAPQLVVVYAIAILYTITFSLAAVVTHPTDKAGVNPINIEQIAKIETKHLKVVGSSSSG
ncbi:hypothetical protein [Nitrosomonas supralitoralis]|uniref:Uncharacterized protein n=1 Tax=Nitrosomonas supralitoralis TaxID=2116706 RepID=A0A2P7NU66_9PROT|nr:hypothetical protein [Nitrosomonas supralitoralis]PSJ17013.1 hypothetical protein C7H79_10260 [Nitrosomonas supralitoralis]